MADPELRPQDPCPSCYSQDKVRYVGDAVAVVVAETRYEAEDALEHIAVEYSPLNAVINPKAAAQDGAPQLHDDVPNNIASRGPSPEAMPMQPSRRRTLR